MKNMNSALLNIYIIDNIGNVVVSDNITSINGKYQFLNDIESDIKNNNGLSGFYNDNVKDNIVPSFRYSSPIMSFNKFILYDIKT